MRTHAGMRLTSLIGALVLWAAAPVAAQDFVELTTQQEIDEAIEKSPDMRKNFDKFKDKLKNQQRQRREQPDVDERELESSLNEPEIQAKNAEKAANSNANVQDLVAEYLVEKGQAAEETFWVVAEQKATPETRELYRNYLRIVYFRGTAKDGNAARGLAQMRAWLDMEEGWQNFPTLNTGEVPPPYAGVYFGGRRHISLVDPKGIAVFSHEMWHFWDDVFGGVDGNIVFNAGGVEPLAYGLMGSELGGGGGSNDAMASGDSSSSSSADAETDAEASLDAVCSG